MLGQWQYAFRLRPVFGVTVLVAAIAYVSLADPVDQKSALLADLKAAAAQLQGKPVSAGIAALKPLSAKLPKLADYIAWLIASAQFEAGSYADVPAVQLWTCDRVAQLVVRLGLGEWVESRLA